MPFIPPSSSSTPRLPFSRSRTPFQNQDKDEHRINERIRVPQVRLVDEKGQQMGVVPTAQALQLARDRGLDLMEVSPNSQPPVCKICDYGKFKYEKKKKEQQAKKKQTVIKVKEIQLRPQTEEHDLEYKFKAVKQFLVDGDKAKITILFKGREVVYVDQGFRIMEKLMDQVKEVGSVEAPPKMDGKKLIMILAPGKKAPSVKEHPKAVAKEAVAPKISTAA